MMRLACSSQLGAGFQRQGILYYTGAMGWLETVAERTSDREAASELHSHFFHRVGLSSGMQHLTTNR